jgi:hypothetical protein
MSMASFYRKMGWAGGYSPSWANRMDDMRGTYLARMADVLMIPRGIFFEQVMAERDRQAKIVEFIQRRPA